MSGNKRKISSGSEISFSELKQLAEDGDAIAQNKLAIRYKNGKGVRKNLKLAAEWFAKSAEQGNLAAQFNIGACYYIGRGVKKDYFKAVEWYSIAAERGDSWSQNDLANCYLDCVFLKSLTTFLNRMTRTGG